MLQRFAPNRCWDIFWAPEFQPETPMKKTLLAVLFLLGLAAGAWASEAPTEAAATVGGGVAHPWKSPYRTAAQAAEILPVQ
jgi:hypothetical protein